MRVSGYAEGMLKDWQSLSLIQEGDIVVDDLNESWRTHPQTSGRRDAGHNRGSGQGLKRRRPLQIHFSGL